MESLPMTAPARASKKGSTVSSERPVTVPDFLAAKVQGRRLTMLTAYDYTMACLLDAAGVASLRVGGFKVQRDADKLLEDAKAIEAAGAFALVVECVPSQLAERITAAVKIPTIGIGAGAKCDGQVLVTPDLLGLFSDLKPRFVKQ